MRPRTLTALLVSAVLGVVAGVGGALYLQRGDAAYADPLGLGVPLVDQHCTGQPLLVVATGDTASAMAGAVAEEPGQVRYLDITRSCNTAWVADTDHPRYAAYVGPFPTTLRACQVRMSAAHRGDLVTRLRAGSTEPVECVCFLPFSAMPVLQRGMDVTSVDGIYIRSLQRLLVLLGQPAVTHSKGRYDATTARQVRAVQHQLGLPTTGIVDADTWHALQTQGCALYPS